MIDIDDAKFKPEDEILIKNEIAYNDNGIIKLTVKGFNLSLYSLLMENNTPIVNSNHYRNNNSIYIKNGEMFIHNFLIIKTINEWRKDYPNPTIFDIRYNDIEQFISSMQIYLIK